MISEKNPNESSAAIEKDQKAEAIPTENEGRLKTSLEIANERADRLMEEAAAIADDIEKIAAIGTVNGLDLSKSIEEKRVKENALKKDMQYGKFDLVENATEKIARENALKKDMQYGKFDVDNEAAAAKIAKENKLKKDMQYGKFDVDDMAEAEEVVDLADVFNETGVEKKEGAPSVIQENKQERPIRKALEQELTELEGNHYDYEGLRMLDAQLFPENMRDEKVLETVENRIAELKKILSGIEPEDSLHIENKSAVLLEKEKENVRDSKSKLDENIIEQGDAIEVPSVKAETALESDEILKDRIKEIKTKKELFIFLDSIDGIQGGRQFFKSADLKKIVSEVIDSKDEKQLNRITRTHNLRDKVREIMLREKIARENALKKDMQYGKFDVDNEAAAEKIAKENKLKKDMQYGKFDLVENATEKNK